jgi:hypothetical protein
MVASHSSGDTPYTSSMASSATDPPSHMSRQLRFSFTSRSFYLPSRYFIYYILISSGSYFSTSLTCITSRSSGHLAPLPFAEGRYATRNVSRCGIIYHTSQCIHNTIHIIFLNSKCQILKTNFLSMFALHNFVQYGGGFRFFFLVAHIVPFSLSSSGIVKTVIKPRPTVRCILQHTSRTAPEHQ